MCKLCLSPTNRDLLLMVLVYSIVAILMLTVSGCSDEPLVRHQAPVTVTKGVDTGDLDKLIARNLERMRYIDASIARLNAINERVDGLLLESRRAGDSK